MKYDFGDARLMYLENELGAADAADYAAGVIADEARSTPYEQETEGVAAIASGRWNGLLASIAETHAESYAGLLVKARILADDAINGNTRHTSAIGASLIRDLERLANTP